MYYNSVYVLLWLVALHGDQYGLAQCKSLLPLGSPVIMTTGKPPPGKYG